MVSFSNSGVEVETLGGFTSIEDFVAKFRSYLDRNNILSIDDFLYRVQRTLGL